MKVVTEITTAVEALRNGGIVAYPTETYYGLGVDATNPKALARLTKLKKRDPKSPYPVLLASKQKLNQYADVVPIQVQPLVDKYWPGPLTIILISSSFPPEVTNEQGGVGFRVSSHDIAATLTKTFELPITTTSANHSKDSPACTAEEIISIFSDEDLVVLDGGPTAGGAPSTVVDFTKPNDFSLKREGSISRFEILRTLQMGS